jgi:proline iminopeptidase
MIPAFPKTVSYPSTLKKDHGCGNSLALKGMHIVQLASHLLGNKKSSSLLPSEGHSYFRLQRVFHKVKLFFSLPSGLLLLTLALQISNAEVKPQSTGIVHTADTDIAYEQFGHDKGRTPAIVVNGGPGFSHTYMYLSDVFTKKFAQERSVTFYDQRGIGQSKLQRASAPQGIEAQVADLEALRAKLGYDKIDLIGHSWGGTLIMAYAAAYPQHIQHLVLIDSGAPKFNQTIFLFKQVFPDQLAEDERAEKGTDPVAKSPGELLRRYLARDFYSQARFNDLFSKLSNADIARVENDGVNDAVNKAVENFDPTESLKKFSFPTLVMWGRFDINVAVLTGWEITQAIPGAKMVVYSKSGHFPFYEEESQFLHDLNSFLDK